MRWRASPFSHPVLVRQVTDIIQNERCLYFTESHEMALNVFLLWKLASPAFFFKRFCSLSWENGFPPSPTTLNKAAQASALLSVSFKLRLYRSHTVMTNFHMTSTKEKKNVKEEMTKKLPSPGSSI